MHKKLLRICSLLIVTAYFAFFNFSCSTQVEDISSADVSGTDAPQEKNNKNNNSSGNNTFDDIGTRSYNPNVDSWTLMFYLGGDNSLDSVLLTNMSQLLQCYCGGMRAVILIDRKNTSTSIEPFGEAFTTTRMYTVSTSGFTRLYGNDLFPELAVSNGDRELDTGDATILRNFIRYSKAEFPAEHYGLIIGSHGGGVRTGNQNARGVVQDIESDNDWIFTAELTDVLGADESVDVLAFDACCMGSLEVAYQFCGTKAFRADYIVASPAEEWSYGWDYRRLAFLFADVSLTPYALACGIVNNYRSFIERNSNDTQQTLTCIRSASIPQVKEKLDNLAALLPAYRVETEALRGKERLQQNNVLHYFNSLNTTYWLQYPYFDIYSLAKRIEADNSFPAAVRSAAAELYSAIDEAVICSYAGASYTLARENSTGLSIFFPCGKERCGITGRTYWDYQYFYNALPASIINSRCYGKLAFCADGATANNGVVENWFELLDYWFDNNRNVNGYIP